jgi:hypothetical protein
MSRRYIVQVVHYPTPPGKAPAFFLQSRLATDPQECQRLVPLAADQLEPLIRSIEAAVKSARAALDANRCLDEAQQMLEAALFGALRGHA